MTTSAVRLTQLEAAVDRLVASRGPRVSDLLKEARSQQGEAALALYDIAALEQDAKLPGLRGAMAKARLRVLRGFDREGLSAGTVAGKDVHGYEGGVPPFRCKGCRNVRFAAWRATGLCDHCVPPPAGGFRCYDTGEALREPVTDYVPPGRAQPPRENSQPWHQLGAPVTFAPPG